MAIGMSIMTSEFRRPSLLTRLAHVLIVLVMLIGWATIILELVGLAFLWTSKSWSERDKILGSLIPLEFYLAVLFLWLASAKHSCSSRVPCTSSSVSVADIPLAVGIIVVVLAAFVTSGYLIRQAWKYQRTV